VAIDGWAIEARLYAEDPARDFLPSTGKLDYLYLPHEARIDTGVEEGDTISPFYDPMIAKLVVHGADRGEARTALAEGCAATCCAPVRTNAWFLRRLAEHPVFASGNISTGFIAEFADELIAAPEPSRLLLQEAAERLIFDNWDEPAEWGHRSLDFRRGLIGFRLNRPPETRVSLYLDGKPLPAFAYDLSLYDSAGVYEVSSGSSHNPREATYFEGGAAFTFTRFADVARAGAGAGDGAILAPMPGRVTAVEVTAGDAVTKGQRLVTLEAMKMEHGLVSPFDGVVAELDAVTGAQVSEGAVLVRVERQP
jgi:3-methylcrotonyl-CoA carboxylase alpha subunit